MASSLLRRGDLLTTAGERALVSAFGVGSDVEVEVAVGRSR